MGLKVAPWDLKCWRQLRNHLPLCRTLRGDRQGLGEATIEGGRVAPRGRWSRRRNSDKVSPKLQKNNLRAPPMSKTPLLADLAITGAQIAVRVTPKAARNRITVEEGAIRVYVTTVPEGGKANAAVQKLLAKSLGVAKSRLRLKRGETSRDKVFEIT